MMVSMSWVHFHSFGGLQTDLDKIVHSSFLISVSGFVSALHFLTLPWAATASMALRTVSSLVSRNCMGLIGFRSLSSS